MTLPPADSKEVARARLRAFSDPVAHRLAILLKGEPGVGLAELVGKLDASPVRVWDAVGTLYRAQLLDMKLSLSESAHVDFIPLTRTRGKILPALLQNPDSLVRDLARLIGSGNVNHLYKEFDALEKDGLVVVAGRPMRLRLSALGAERAREILRAKGGTP